jgi:hypothetical protein
MRVLCLPIRGCRKVHGHFLRVCSAYFYALVGSLNLGKHELSSKTKTFQIKYLLYKHVSVKFFRFYRDIITDLNVKTCLLVSRVPQIHRIFRDSSINMGCFLNNLNCVFLSDSMHVDCCRVPSAPAVLRLDYLET